MTRIILKWERFVAVIDDEDGRLVYGLVETICGGTEATNAYVRFYEDEDDVELHSLSFEDIGKIGC